MKVANDSYLAGIATSYKDVDGDYDWSTYIGVVLTDTMYAAVREKVLKDKDLDINDYPDLQVYVDISSTAARADIQLFVNDNAMDPFVTIDLVVHVQYSIA